MSKLMKKIALLLLSIIFLLVNIVTIYAAPGISPNSDYPIFITIDENPGENIFIFTDRLSSYYGGNWIELSNGVSHNLPSSTINLDLIPDIRNSKWCRYHTRNNNLHQIY